MKKLLIVATAVMLAGLTQAATVKWQITGSAASEGKVAYLVLTDKIPATVTDLSDITGAAFASGEIADIGRGKYGASGTANLPDTDIAAGDTAGYTIFFVDTASNSYLNGGTGSVTAYGASDPVVNPTASNPTYTAPGGAGWTQVEAVPEPTAVALLALGLAALGLKRKVA